MFFCTTIQKQAMCFLCAAALCLSLSGRAQAGQTETAGGEVPLVAVQYVDKTVKIDWDAVVAGDIQDSVSYGLFGGKMSDLEEFLLRPRQPVIFEICRAGEMVDGNVPPGEIVAQSEVIQPGEIYIFSHNVPEGMPTLFVCAKTDAKRLCWAPAFSGEDGSLMVSPGFALYKQEK